MTTPNRPKLKKPLSDNSILPWESNPEEHQAAFDKPLREDFTKVRLSLVIPIYNSGKFLEKTLRSILFSNLENVQIIVSDGGSSDTTHEILDYYKEIFDIVISGPDKGQSDAINKGFSRATGELLGWLNGDDLLVPYALDYVRSKYLVLAKPDFMVGNAYMVEKDLVSIIWHKQYSDEKVRFEHLIDWASNHLVQPSCFFTKKAWENVGPLDINDHYAMDADLFLTLAKEYGARHLWHRGLSYSVYHEDCKTRGKQAESITQLALVQCKHGGYQEARKSLDYLVEMHNNLKSEATSSNANPVSITDTPLIKLDIQQNKMPTTLSKHVGKYIRYPRSESKRIAEGGQRLNGVYKTDIEGVPLVTIITVCRNSDQTIRQTFDSVRNQSYPNIEYLVIDACSTDGTLRIIQENEDLIDYYVSEQDRGLYHAMNKGIELAQGEYILILNSDDWYEPHCVESLVKALKLTNADFTCALARWVDGDGKPIKVLEKMPYDHSLNFGNSLRHELMLISREIYNQLGLYDERYPIIADLDFTLRLFDSGFRLYELCVPLLNFRVTGTSNTNWNKLDNEHFLLLKSRFPDIDSSILEKLSCERSIDAEMLHDILRINLTNSDFQEALVAYGYRRGFFDSTNPPPKINKAKSPRVSIAMPAYNAGKFIRSTLNSILQQEVADIEVICVNDCSTDDTLDILNEIAANDNRLKVFSNEVNKGETISRNTALSYCTGEYVLFVDADDQLTNSGLSELVEFADLHYSDMVKGGMEKINPDGSRINFSGSPSDQENGSLNCNESIINTTLASSHVFLRASEGFFTYLYRRSFLRNFRFPEGYKMGGDSLFLATILSNAMRLSWIDACVTKYVQHPNQATKTYSWEKMLHDIDWRYKVWQIMNLQGLKEVGQYIAHEYWDPKIIANLRSFLDADQYRDVSNRFALMLANTGFQKRADLADNVVTDFMHKMSSSQEALDHSFGNLNLAQPSTKAKDLVSIKIGVFNTFTSGGAAIASQRLRDGLRKGQINAQSYSLFNASPNEAHQKVRSIPDLKTLTETQQAWEDCNIKPAYNDPHHCTARELFSLSNSLADPSHLTELFNFFDLLHFHWVSGLLDYKLLSTIPADKPIVWTLHDMHPFTGGCHYSEGCLSFMEECAPCHLLKPDSTLARDELRLKKKAIDRLVNLHIITPSVWLKELAEKSQLFKGRPVHHVPNVMPTDTFRPINHIIARLRLGLPLNKRLLLFGADNISSLRKGGDILQSIASRLRQVHASDDVQVVFFGYGQLSLPYPSHNLGHISDESQLALIYSAADLFIFPSREDNAPMSVVESLLCGTPVVASDVGNIRELISHKDNGYIVQPGDVEEFCNGIEWILNLSDSEIWKCRTRCSIRSRSYHSKDSISSKLKSIYKSALSYQNYPTLTT